MTDLPHHDRPPRPGTPASSDDAEGYFLEGAPIQDTKAPGGPIERAVEQAPVRGAGWSTRPTAAS